MEVHKRTSKVFLTCYFLLMLFYEGEGTDENAESIDFEFGRYIKGENNLDCTKL